MRILLLRIVPAVIVALVFAHPASAVERISLSYDRNAGQISGFPASFQPQAAQFSLPGGTGPRPDVRYVSYPVFGKSFVEIMKSIEENGVQVAGRAKRSASSFEWITGLSLLYDYTYEIDEEEMMAVVSLEVSDMTRRDGFRITLPHLVNDTALNPIELSLYQEYLSRLLEHEHQRMDLVRNEGIWEDIGKGLRQLKVFKVALVEDMDLERTIESIVAKEVARLAMQRAERVRDLVRDFDRKKAPFGEQGKK